MKSTSLNKSINRRLCSPAIALPALWAVVAALSVAACSDTTEAGQSAGAAGYNASVAGQGAGGAGQGTGTAGQGPGVAGQDPGPDGRVGRQVAALTAELEPVVDGNNRFALSLYRQIVGAPEVQDRNLFLSPFSLSAALAMTYAGADGETAQEMAEVLEVQAEEAVFHQELGALMADLNGDKPGRGYQLYIASRLFGQQDWPFEEAFLTLNQQHYGAALQELDYCAQPEQARATINDWVAGQTMDKIEELFPEGQFDCNTALALVSAIYFKADWAEQFDPDATADRPFRLLSGETVSVPTMSAELAIHVAEQSDLTMLDIAYQDDELSMVILLPAEPDGLPELEASLEPERIEQLIADSVPDELSVELPRFEIRSKPEVKQALIDLGMVTAFDPGAADFSRMASGPPLAVDDVVHEAYVLVDEKGTEAAAASGVEMTFRAAPLPIQVAHPFLFLIRDRLTESILFMGRVVDPLQTSE
jgi:serpin B